MASTRDHESRSWARRLVPAAGVVVALCLEACSSVGKPLAPPSEAFTRPRGPIVRDEYRLQVGDRLNIKFPFHRRMSQELPIRPDGNITLEPTGELQAAGLTPGELEAVIRRESANRLRDPEVIVIVTKFGDRRVYVGGEVARPGFVTIQEGMTPLQAVMAVGGFKDTAAKESVLYIARDVEGSYQASRVDLEDVVRNGVAETVRLAPSDVVYVPASRIANANLFVKQYIRDLLPVDSKAGATASYPILQ